LQEFQTNETKYASEKEVVFDVGDKVLLSTWHLRMTRLSKKLEYKLTGPYRVRKSINKNRFRLDLPYTIRKHNVFHVS
jgi:hypothetical protein